MDGFRLCALLVATLLSNVAPQQGVFHVFLQQPPSFKGNGDSPRRSHISPFHVSEGASSKFLARKLEPEYPYEAQAAGVEGDVIFRIVVGTNGRVEEIHLRRGKPVLIEAAAKALSLTWNSCRWPSNCRKGHYTHHSSRALARRDGTAPACGPQGRDGGQQHAHHR
jgi:Gram-negative bacterial TonB protein C-terminal